MRSLLLLVFLAAPGLAQAPVIRDSAGVRIVTSAVPRLTGAQAMRVAVDPSVVVPEDNSEATLFSRIMGVGRLSDGRIVVADGASLQLRFFDNRGRFVNAAVGKGSGPGEATRMTSVVVAAGDTLILIAEATRVAFYDGRGRFLYDVNLLTPPAVQLPPGAPMILAALPNGATLVTPMRSGPPRTVGGRQIAFGPVSLLGRSRATVAALGEQPMMELAASADAQPPWLSAQLVAAASGTRVFLGFGTEYAVREFDASGRLTQIVRRAWTAPRVTDAMREAFITEWTSRWIKSAGPARAQDIAEFRRSPISPTLPAFSRFLVDRAGRLWVRTPNAIDAARAGQLNGAPLAPSIWSVFERDGTWRSEITLPTDFQPFDVGTDYVLGVLRDADGVESVVQYRLYGG